jgi:hypothetical protein
MKGAEPGGLLNKSQNQTRDRLQKGGRLRHDLAKSPAAPSP